MSIEADRFADAASERYEQRKNNPLSNKQRAYVIGLLNWLTIEEASELIIKLDNRRRAFTEYMTDEQNAAGI